MKSFLLLKLLFTSHFNWIEMFPASYLFGLPCDGGPLEPFGCAMLQARTNVSNQQIVWPIASISAEILVTTTITSGQRSHQVAVLLNWKTASWLFIASGISIRSHKEGNIHKSFTDVLDPSFIAQWFRLLCDKRIDLLPKAIHFLVTNPFK